MKITKKVTLMLLLLITSLLLVSCGDSDKTIDEIVDGIKIQSEVTDDFTLPTFDSGYNLSWSTASENISFSDISNNSITIIVTRGNVDIDVELGLIISNGELSKSKTFSFKLLKLEETNLVQVKFYDGDTLLETKDLPLNSKVVLINAPVKEDYNFDAWYLEKTFKTKLDTNYVVSSNLSLYAKYDSKPTNNDDKLEADYKYINDYIFAFDDERLNFDDIKAPNGSTIKWSSSNKDILSNNGYVFYTSKDEKVTLTATLSLNSKSKVVTKELTVPAFNRSKTLSFKIELKKLTNLDSSVPVSTTSMLYAYYLNNGEVPYVDIEDFFKALNGFFVKDMITFTYDKDKQTILLEYTFDSIKFSAKIDFLANTITTDSYGFFNYYTIDYNDDQGDSSDFGLTDTLIEEINGKKIVFDLNKYRINSFQYESNGSTKYLMPFHVVNLIFTGGSYYNSYYNGDAFYGFYELPINDNDEYYSEVVTSKYNGKKMADDIVYTNYNVLAFTLNNLYGLKNPSNIIDDYYTLLKERQDGLLTNDSQKLAKTTAEIFYYDLDDLHNSLGLIGYYNSLDFDFDPYSGKLGNRINTFYNESDQVLANADRLYSLLDSQGNIKSNYKTYQFLDTNTKTTARILLEDFTLPGYGNDSLSVINKALENIFKESSNVTNIILDLSINGGGQVGAVYHVLGFMTNMQLLTSEINPLENSSYTMSTSVKLNGVKADTLTKSRKANWYILSTMGTFSSANMTVAMAKNQGIATIIGKKSGGGASSIQPIVLVDGSIYFISGLNVLALREGDTYKSVEFGIEPDYAADYSTLFNNSKLMTLISSLKN